VASFIFDETRSTYLARSRDLGLNVPEHLASGTMMLRQIDSAEFSAGRFTHLVRETVERGGARMVIIDSLSGYVSAMPEERFLVTQVHELLTFLSHRNVVTILTLAQHGVVGEGVTAPVDLSYLADTVLLLRYFEAAGSVRRALSVVKKRRGAHEVFLREMRVEASGVIIGDPLTQFQGILTGRPEFTDAAAQLRGGE
jgi:circadian clock protein KaiC